ncbi:DUF1947 domain-containing protein [Candidatus Woesearchaeota archaeon]|nr:DUF1947 domain-containing protein [Candidatus Woesearchaeota archaeon]
MKKRLSKSDIKDLNSTLENEFGLESFYSKKDIVELEDSTYILKNGQLHFFYHEQRLFPSLKLLLKQEFLKRIIVDMGAVRFVANGADIMRPGVTQADEDIKEDECVVIIEETHHKPLAVGISLYGGKELLAMNTGKVIRTIHYVGDAIWNHDE